MRDFKKLEIWTESIKLVKSIYEISGKLPSEEKFGLKSQIQRAAVSIPSNIAEGSSRSSDKEFRYFLEIAIGSSFELETQLIILTQLGLTNCEVAPEIFIQLGIIQKKLNALISKIKTDATREH